MDIARLTTQLAAGIITTEYISTLYGDDVLTQVLAGMVGGVAGGVAYDAVDDLFDGAISDMFDFF